MRCLLTLRFADNFHRSLALRFRGRVGYSDKQISPDIAGRLRSLHMRVPYRKGEYSFTGQSEEGEGIGYPKCRRHRAVYA